MKNPKVSFLDRELDAFLGQWLGGQIRPAELQEWQKILSHDSRFREQFCDWVRSLREPAWIRDRQPTNRKAR